MTGSNATPRTGYKKAVRVTVDKANNVNVCEQFVPALSTVPSFSVQDQRDVSLADALNPALMGRVTTHSMINRNGLAAATALYTARRLWFDARCEGF
jgi:hypothetical protein